MRKNKTVFIITKQSMIHCCPQALQSRLAEYSSRNWWSEKGCHCSCNIETPIFHLFWKKLNSANVISICSNNWKQNVFFYSCSKFYLWSTIFDCYKWPDRRRSKVELNDVFDDLMNTPRTFPHIQVEIFMIDQIDILSLNWHQGVLKVWVKKYLRWELNPQHWLLLGKKTDAHPTVPTRYAILGRRLFHAHFGLVSFLESIDHDFIKVLKIQTDNQIVT